MQSESAPSAESGHARKALVAFGGNIDPAGQFAILESVEENLWDIPSVLPGNVPGGNRSILPESRLLSPSLAWWLSGSIEKKRFG
jgi:hypothetical protein